MKRITLTFVLAGIVCSTGLVRAANAEKPAAARLPESQQIDALLAADWKANKLQGNPAAPDEIFVRRIYLDTVGRIPTERETQEFMNSKDANKRAKLIDKLLSSEGYVQHFFNYWADILRAQTSGQQLGGVTGVAYTKFIKDSLRSNEPYDKFVRDMVSAQGKAWEDGAIGYYMRDRGMPLDNMATTVRIFLGTRVECAQCHNHPFDKWSQKQFYEMAAFTYGVNTNDYNAGPLKGVRDILQARETELRQKIKLAGGKPDAALLEQQEQMRQDGRHINEALQRGVRDPLRYTSLDFQARKLQLPHDYKYPDAKPKDVVNASVMMGKPIVDCPQGADSLKAYAEWMASAENPRFTTVIANRLWKKVFGMGLIEPVDELMDSTVAMNPALMKHLEKLMVAHHYDMKAYLRVLFNTQAYQNCVSREEVPAGVAYHFTGPVLRRMSAEQMWDSFVALINPTPDMLNLTALETADKRLNGSRKLYDAMETMTPEEMLKGAEVAAGKYREQASQLKEIQTKIAAAREADDKETVKALNKESGDLQRNALKSVSENIVVPAVLKLQAQVSSKEGAKTEAKDGKPDAAAAPAANSSMMMLGGDVESNMAKIQIDGYDKPKKTDAELAAEREEQRKVILDEAAYFGIPEKQQKQYVNYRLQQERSWLRSAEIDSPAPRGHYLREFGQSDREYVENGNSDASVPQVLVMMNSQLLPQIIDPYSQLMLTINKAQYPDDKVEAAYLTLLSRKPTAREKQVWLAAQDKGLSTMEDLIYALINTQQFIFIQ